MFSIPIKRILWYQKKDWILIINEDGKSLNDITRLKVSFTDDGYCVEK